MSRRPKGPDRPFKGPGSAYIAGSINAIEWISDGKLKIIMLPDNSVEGWIFKCEEIHLKWSGFDKVEAGKWEKRYDFLAATPKESWKLAYDWYMRGLRE